MAKIEINLVVLNPQEIVEREKGKLAEWFSKLFMDEAKVQREVEKAVVTELIRELQEKVPAALKDRGVRAEITFSISEPKEDL